MAGINFEEDTIVMKSCENITTINYYIYHLISSIFIADELVAEDTLADESWLGRSRFGASPSTDSSVASPAAMDIPEVSTVAYKLD